MRRNPFTHSSGLTFRAGLLGVLCLSLLWTTAQAQTWQRMEGPLGGRIEQLHRHQGKFFTGTVFGLYQSTDGESWSLIDDLPRATFQAVETSGSSLLAGSYSYGVYRSTDGGGTWSNTLTTAVHDFQLHDGCVYVSTDLDGIYQSCDNGQTWTNITGTLGGLIPQIASDGSYLYAMSGANLYRSTGNSTWTNLSSSLPGSGSLMAMVGKADTLVVVRSHLVYRSSDYGQTWAPISAVNTTDPTVIPYSLRIAGSKLIVGFNSAHGVWVGNLDGTGFTNLGAGLPAGNSIWDSYSHNDTLWVGTARGIYRSSLQNPSWTYADRGITNTSISDFTALGDTLYASTRTAGQSANRHIYRSVDNGVTWHPHGIGFGPNSDISVLQSHQGKLFASYLSTLYSSTDAQNFSTVMQAVGLVSDIEDGVSSFLVSSLNSGLHESTNGGQSFTAVNSPNQMISFVKERGSELFVGTPAGLYHRDAAGVWTLLNNGLPGGYEAVDLAFDGQNLVASFQSGANTVIKYSTNDGQRWSDAQGLPANIYAGDIELFNGTYYLASDASHPHGSTTQGGIWKSTDGGSTWTDAGAGLPQNTSVRKLFSHNGSLYAGTHLEGIYKFSGPNVGVAEPSGETSFHVYPNPASDYIRWEENQGKVMLLNALGAVIVKADAGAGILDISQLKPGLYFVRYESGSRVTSRKIIKQ